MLTSRPPWISVILPLHDVASYVWPCLLSVSAQSETDFEVIAVDDGSSDGSGEIARRFAEGDSRVRVLSQPNRGLSAARNTGLDVARGEWVAFVDGDDRVAPGWLAGLLAAAERAEAPWAFCGIRFVPMPGEVPGPHAGSVHSAVHDAPDLAPCDAMELGDWPAIVRLFPSAWNKIYRRDLIGETRFEEGVWYEDHAFYWALAGKAARIGRAPAALYWQSRGRAGQITGLATDKVMDQIHVLAQFPAIAARSGKPGKRAAHGRLIARLSHERAEVITEPALRARFAQAAGALAAQEGVRPDPGPEETISHSFLRRLTGRWPLSAIVPVDAESPAGALDETLATLAAQGFADFETVVVHGGVPSETTRETVAAWCGRLPLLRQETVPESGAGALRNAGLAAARGDLVSFLDAGDRVGPPAYGGWAEGMLRHGAVLGISAFHVGNPEEPEHRSYHSGFHDPAAFGGVAPAGGMLELDGAGVLALHPHPSAKVFDRAFLGAHGLRFGAGRYAAWEVTLRAACAAGRAVYQSESGLLVDDRPARRRIWRGVPAPEEITGLIARLSDLDPDLPAGWQRRLFARAAWEVACFADFPSETTRQDWRRAVAAQPAAVAGRAAEAVALDPFLDDWARWLVCGDRVSA